VSHDALTTLGLRRVHVIALESFEKGDDDLLTAKRERTPIEYYFTCSPSLPLFILNHYPEVDVITYLDADLFFFADPAPIYDEFGDRSIGIVGHRFPPHLQSLEHYSGIYNVGWMSFRRDANALACLRWWRQRCLEWCFDRYENGRFADQKYLDDWPSRFQRVAVLQHKGANLAPWNLANYTIRTDGERVLVDDDPLIFFHFHGLQQIGRRVYDPHLAEYKTRASAAVRRGIYTPYIRALVETAPHLPSGIRRAAIRPSAHEPAAGLRWLRHILQHDYFVVLNGRVF
jgi:hypothetical protein